MARVATTSLNGTAYTINMMYRSILLLGGAIQLAVAMPALAQRPATPNDTIRLSLDEAVTIGLRVADEVRLSAAQADVADAQVDLARSAMLPQIRINSAYTRTFESARATAVNAVFNQPNTYTANANFSQTLFQGGRLVAAGNGCRLNLGVQVIDLFDQRVGGSDGVDRLLVNLAA